jgi:site-specific recombinase XerD
MRCSELVGISLDAIDFQEQVISIHGKGRGGGKWRVVGYDEDTATALRRYLRKRRAHPLADSEMLWLGERGVLSAQAVALMLKRRAKQAGVADVHPHRFRDAFAVNWLADGGGESALRTLACWSSPP